MTIRKQFELQHLLSMMKKKRSSRKIDDIDKMKTRVAIRDTRRNRQHPNSMANLKKGGGKKGRSGRTPEAWRELCRELVSRKATIKAAKTILRNEDHPAWNGAFKFITEQGYGRAKESLELKGTLTLEDLVAGSREVVELNEDADDTESIDENDD